MSGILTSFRLQRFIWNGAPSWSMRFYDSIFLANDLQISKKSRVKPQALLFLTMMAGWMNRQQQHVIDYLVEENRVLREQLDIHAKGKRIRFNASQRRRLAEKGQRLGRKVLLKIANLVTPETIYAWHRKFVAMKFAPKGRDHSAAHARREERNALIIRLAMENAGWGYSRIQGIMQNLGWTTLSTSTIGEVLRKVGILPSPERSSRVD